MKSSTDRPSGLRRTEAGKENNTAKPPSRFLADLHLFDLIGKGLFGLDLEDGGRIIAVGRVGAAVLERTVSDIVGFLPDDLLPEAVTRSITEHATLASPRSVTIETPLPTTGAPDRIIAWTLHDITHDGKHLALLETEDVTTRKHNEKRLRNLFRAVEQSPASVVITNTKGVIEYVNPRFTQNTGYGFDEVIGQTPSIVKSGFTSDQQYRDLWNTITAGREWHGELLNRRKNGEMFWEHISISPVRNEDGEIAHFIAVKEDITDRKEYEKRLRYQAHYDELTKLPNRILITDRLGQALARADRNQDHVGVAFIDLDDFKKVNDTLGHTYGDDLLRVAARRLMSCIRSSDTVGRLGGDEFLVILPDLKDGTHASTVADKILAAFEDPFIILGHSITTTASIGLTLYPDDGREAEILMRNADAAMYLAKDAGRNCQRCFHPEINTIAMHRLRMESLLRGAVTRNELFVVYQPQICAADGHLVGAEALVRWQSPEFGLVPPLDFIGLAEDSGLIEPIGQFVLETACRQFAAWQTRLPPGTRISVNVSTRQVASPSFSESVAKTLWETGLSPSLLEIELTESLFALRTPVIMDNLTRLRRIGIRLAVDDFGTGYSSLSYLREFPVDSVKIDRSFLIPVGDPAADALVRAIVAMGHSLSLQVVAEGIETLEQMAFLKTIACDVAQGFHIARPLVAKDFLPFALSLHGHHAP
ncbi:MAG: EAL domain-containing protein [Rhodospirillaceae bacterium]|nr:EAL domain-containing protein [Rhodospirillaceae bacterium]